MTNFILILLCVAGGMIFRYLKMLPADAHKGINTWLIYIALPAISFKYLPHIELSEKLIIPALAPVIVWLGGWVFCTLYAAKNKLDKKTEGALKLSSGLCNTSFVGFPLVSAYYGEKQIGIAIISDQVTFLLLSTAALVVAINSSGKHELSVKLVLKKMFMFPALSACIIAITLPRYIDISFLDPLFDKLSATVAPLALFSIGMQLNFEGWKQQLKHISAALLYKLFLAPALVLIFILILKMQGMEAKVGLFEAAMPTLVTGGILASEYDLNPKLSNLIIGIGILACFITTAMWYAISNLLL